MKKISLCLFSVCWGLGLIAQKTSYSKLIYNVTLHDGVGKTIANAAIGFSGSKITFVGSQDMLAQDTFAEKIDGKGQHVYPGFIAANTKLGLEELEAVRATQDYAEVGNYNPHVRSLIAYNTDSDIIPTVRFNGVLTAQVAPQSGGIISGTSAIVTTESNDNWEERAYVAQNGIHINWPAYTINSGWWAEPEALKRNERYLEQVRQVRDFFTQAKAYCANDKPSPQNLRFEAMRKVFDRSEIVFVNEHDAPGILDAISLSRDFNFKLVILGGYESYKVTEELKKANVPVILSSIHSLPLREDDDIDLPYRLPSILQEKGVTFGLCMEGSWRVRNLSFLAGTARAYGLTQEQALRAITSSVAKILGIDNRTGSLEVGKEATLLLVEGDLLDMKSSNIQKAFILGKEVSLDNKQKNLYHQYKHKYGFEDGNN